jgi:hypothetical protein
LKEDRHRSFAAGPAATAGVESAATLAGGQDADQVIRELRRAKRELEMARLQFDTVTDPMLIDHMVFRLGAAERQFNYLFQLARRHGIRVEGVRWDWNEAD